MKTLKFISISLLFFLCLGSLQGQTNNKPTKADSSKTHQKKPMKKATKDTSSAKKTSNRPDNTWEK